MKFIIPTCDKYRNIIEANKYTMDKFGGSNLDVTVLGYKKPDFDMGSWKFVSLGEDTGAKNFSNDMIKFFETFEDEFFIYGNDDVVAVDHVNTDIIDDLVDVMKKDPTVGKALITTASLKNIKVYDIYSNGSDNGVRKDYFISQIKQNAEYRLSLHYSLWRTSYFKKYLVPNISPWEWELRPVAKNDGVKILSTLGKYFLDFGHIFRTGVGDTGLWVNSEYTGKSLSPEDIAFVRKCITNCQHGN
jgi:hypothetical protein